VHSAAPNARRVQQRGNAKAGIGVDEVRTTIYDWRAVLPVQGTEDDDLSAALDAVKKHRLAFGDAMLWAVVQRAGSVDRDPAAEMRVRQRTYRRSSR
jgi:hypothetical protein